MTKLGMAALSSMAMAAVLAGCTSGTYGTGKHVGQLRSTDLGTEGRLRAKPIGP